MISFVPEPSGERTSECESKAQQLLPSLPQRIATTAMGKDRLRHSHLLDNRNSEATLISARLNSYNPSVSLHHEEFPIDESRNHRVGESNDEPSCSVAPGKGSSDSVGCPLVSSRNQLRGLFGEMGMALFAPLDIEGLSVSSESEWRDDRDADFKNHHGTKFIGCKLHSDHARLPHHLQHERKRPLTSSEGSLTAATATETVATDCEEEDDFDSCWIFPEPLMSCPRVLTHPMLQQLSVHFPLSCQGHMLERCFCIGMHGDSILSMLHQCRLFRYTLMVIQTTYGEVIGGFATANWNDKRHNVYYGNGQSFLFSSCPAVSFDRSVIESPTISVYPWSGDNDYCQICDPDQNRIAMGGEGDFGLIIRDNFGFGETGCSRTYRNPPLVPSGQFEIASFEVYGIVPFSLSPLRFSSATI